MSKHLHRDMELLKKEILSMGALVWEAINGAMIALGDRRPDLAQRVLMSDDAINAKEISIEEECLKILALHQPVAADLRFVVTILKVNNDLERMGDLAANLAERVVYLSSHEPIDVPLDFDRMVSRVHEMVRRSLDALVEQNTTVAREILAMDDEVDDALRDMYVILQELMQRDPDAVVRAVHTLSVSRHLERIADLATNIAEDIVFMVDGEVIRHQHEGLPAADTMPADAIPSISGRTAP